MANSPEIPVYSQADTDSYKEDLNQSLRQLLNDDGWKLPLLTAAQVVLITPTAPVGAQWYNSTTNKMQIMTAGGIETITSA